MPGKENKAEAAVTKEGLADDLLGHKKPLTINILATGETFNDVSNFQYL